MASLDTPLWLTSSRRTGGREGGQQNGSFGGRNGHQRCHQSGADLSINCTRCQTTDSLYSDSRFERWWQRSTSSYQRPRCRINLCGIRAPEYFVPLPVRNSVSKSGVEEIHSVCTINNVETFHFTQLKICYLMTTFRCPADILITSWLFTALWSTWPGNHLVPLVTCGWVCRILQTFFLYRHTLRSRNFRE